MYGAEVAKAIMMANMSCECCGERDIDKLKRVPPIMGGPYLTAPLSRDDRFICSACITIWYENGLTTPEEIGAKHRELKAAGEYPFSRVT
jgi:hypothetical protein